VVDERIWKIAQEEAYPDEVEQHGQRVEEIATLVRSLHSGELALYNPSTGVVVPRQSPTYWASGLEGSGDLPAADADDLRAMMIGWLTPPSDRSAEK